METNKSLVESYLIQIKELDDENEKLKQKNEFLNKTAN
jgi:hypothetical protein